MNPWIKTSERLPEPGSTVLVYWEQIKSHWMFDVATFQRDDYWHEPENDEDDFLIPTHWMPIPELPKEP